MTRTSPPATRCRAGLACAVGLIALMGAAGASAQAQTGNIGKAPGVAKPAAAQANAAPAQAAPDAAGSSTATSTTAGPTGAFAGLSKNSGQPINIESDILYVHDAEKYATFKGNVKAVQGTTILHSQVLDVHYVGGGSDSLASGSSSPPDASASAATGAAPAAGLKTADATPAANAAVAQDAAPKPASGSAGNSGPAATPAAGAKGNSASANAAAAGGVAVGDNGTKITKIYARGDVVITSDQDQTTTGEWAIYDVPAQMVTVGGNVVLTQGQNVLKGDRLLIDLTTGESRFENPTPTPGKRIRALFMPKQNSGSGDSSAKSSGDAKGQSGTESADSDSASGAKSDATKPSTEKPSSAAAPDDASPWQLIPSTAQ